MILMMVLIRVHWGWGKRPGELLNACQLKVVKVDQAKRRPEQSLGRLPEAGGGHHDYEDDDDVCDVDDVN